MLFEVSDCFKRYYGIVIVSAIFYTRLFIDTKEVSGKFLLRHTSAIVMW